MNELLKLQIGKRGTIANQIYVEGGTETEYIQGVLREVEDDIIVIEQYLPYMEFLKGNKPTSIMRRLKLSNGVDFIDVWR